MTEQRHRQELVWFKIVNDKGVARCASWVRERPMVNTMSGMRTDKNGNFYFLLGWDDRPDSDWGRFKGNSAAVWCKTEELAKLAEIEIRRGLGWYVEGEAVSEGE